MSTRRHRSLPEDEEESDSYKVGEEVQGLITMLEREEVPRKGSTSSLPHASRLVDDPDELLAVVADTKSKHRVSSDIDYSKYFWNFLTVATVIVWVAVLFVWIS
jgi:hypothetical protein